MDVPHRLATVAVRVEDCTEAARRHSALLRDRRRPPHQLADELVVVCLKIVERVDVPLRDDEHVGWRLRVDVLEGDNPVVFEHDAARNLTVDDSAEQAVAHRIQLGSARSVSVRRTTATRGMPPKSRLNSIIVNPAWVEINWRTDGP